MEKGHRADRRVVSGSPGVLFLIEIPDDIYGVLGLAARVKKSDQRVIVGLGRG